MAKTLTQRAIESQHSRFYPQPVIEEDLNQDYGENTYYSRNVMKA